MNNIDIDKVKNLLDSYWKKWEPYEYPFTKGYIESAKEDFLYRINLYNDLMKRNDLSHFYPFRTILDRMAKYQKLLNFTSKERENWLYLDMKEGWIKMSKDSMDSDDIGSDSINDMLHKVEQRFNLSSSRQPLYMKSITSKNIYGLYGVMSEYIHGSLLSKAIRESDVDLNQDLNRIIVTFLEYLGTVEESCAKETRTKDGKS